MHALSTYVISTMKCIIFFYLQVKKLSFLFKLEPATVFLVEEIDNTAIFPTDTSRFCTTQISPGMTYEVHGELAAKGQQPHSDTSAQPNSPYGLYTTPVFASSQRPHSTPINQPHFTRVPKKAIRKAISLVSLTSVDA